MAITQFKPEEQNVAQAPTLGMASGTFGDNAQQRKNITQGGSGRFTNLQQYIQANEANNPNAQLLQKEATARQGELGTRQQEFTKQAEPIKSGFEAVKSGQQFVQSALQDPTKIVQDPSNIQRFAQYRTQGLGDIETPYNQLQSMRGTLGTQQEQLASNLELIQKDPNALQNYLQSQRINPSLATRGENVLDRFLTKSTESGQQALAGLGTTAGVIRSTQAPAIIGDIESLRSQVQGQLLSSADVGNLLTGKITPEEEFVRSINPEYLSQKLGLSESQPDNPRFTKLEAAKARRDTINRYNARIAQTDKDIIDTNNKINEINNTINQLENIDISRGVSGLSNAPSRNSEEINRQKSMLNDYKNLLNNIITDKGNLQEGLSRMDVSLQPKLEEYEKGLTLNKQQLLQQYDPTRLSRIQALQQLAGTTQFNPLLSGGIQ